MLAINFDVKAILPNNARYAAGWSPVSSVGTTSRFESYRPGATDFHYGFIDNYCRRPVYLAAFDIGR